MDARVGRQADEFVEIIEKIKREGHHPGDGHPVGNNGPLYGEDMEALRKATTNVGELFLISDHAPVSWKDESNEAIAEAAEDWHHTTEIPGSTPPRRRESLLWDGIHLTPKGGGVYARLVSQAVHEKIAFPKGSHRATAVSGCGRRCAGEARHLSRGRGLIPPPPSRSPPPLTPSPLASPS